MLNNSTPKHLIKSFFFLILTLICSTVFAQSIWHVKILKGKTPTKHEQIEGSYKIELNRSALANLDADSQIVVNITPTDDVKIHIQQKYVDNGKTTWLGIVADESSHSKVIFTLGEQSFFGNIVFSKGAYSIRVNQLSGKIINDNVLKQRIDTKQPDYLIPPESDNQQLLEFNQKKSSLKRALLHRL